MYFTYQKPFFADTIKNKSDVTNQILLLKRHPGKSFKVTALFTWQNFYLKQQVVLGLQKTCFVFEKLHMKPVKFRNWNLEFPKNLVVGFLHNIWNRFRLPTTPNLTLYQFVSGFAKYCFQFPGLLILGSLIFNWMRLFQFF